LPVHIGTNKISQIPWSCDILYEVHHDKWQCNFNFREIKILTLLYSEIKASEQLLLQIVCLEWWGDFAKKKSS
jgi:hypothetical protein